MSEVIKEKSAQILAIIITFLTIFTVNSTCYLGLGQENEPKSLKRLKK